jgi:hypothetical protein
MAKPSHPQDKYAELRDKLWTAFFIALLLAVIGYSIYIQIIHHT